MRRLRVAQVVARLNLGGPALHVAMLDHALRTQGHASLVVCGQVGPGEVEATEMLRSYDVTPLVLPQLGPAMSPARDLRAFGALWRQLRNFQPDVVHTHTAKAGVVGRVAALAACGNRVARVHTFHGHVLRGYFRSDVSALIRWLERRLALITDKVVCVSQATREELLELGLTSADRLTVIPLGFDSEPFAAVPARTSAEFRAAASARPGDVLVGFTGRLVPNKRVDRLIRATAAARDAGAPVRLAVVGDGPLRAELERTAAAMGIARFVHFLGYREDMPAVAAGCDIGALSSDAEGTPVWLMEAAAAGRPVVATRVGGVAEVVGEGGILLSPGDVPGLAAAIERLAGDSSLRTSLGAAARDHVREHFMPDRRLAEIEALYAELASRRSR